MPTAITRRISSSLARCELTHLSRGPIDLERARAQHSSYEQCLRSLGCTVLTLPPDPDLPDCVFVEDTALAVDELATADEAVTCCSLILPQPEHSTPRRQAQRPLHRQRVARALKTRPLGTCTAARPPRLPNIDSP